MEVKDVKVSHDEYSSGKYKYSSYRGQEEYFVKIWYNDDGSINEEYTYIEPYLAKKRKQEEDQNVEDKTDKKTKKKKEKKNKKNKKSESNSDEDGCLTKILKAPFKGIWWLIKKILLFILSIVTLGLINKYLKDE